MNHIKRIWLFIAVAGAVVGGVSPSGAGDPTPKLVTEHFMIDASDPSIKLYIRNKRPEGMTEFKSEKTLLFIHGATQPAEATFDLPLENLSWMDYIARRGWDVYLVDVRGYGSSTRPPEMDQPPENNPPIATTDVAVRDLKSAVDFILHRRSLSKINLMGWSWGTVIAAAYAADHPDKVERLVLFGPAWVRSAPSAPSSRPLGAYIETPMSRSRERMQVGAPEDRKSDLMPSSWFEAWSAAVLDTDPLGSKQNPPVLRSPNGVFQDNRDYWDGEAILRPSKDQCSHPDHRCRVGLSGARRTRTLPKIAEPN